MTVPFIGPSYSLATAKADVQRTVNQFPVMNEVAGGKTGSYLQSVAGLDLFSAPLPPPVITEGILSHFDLMTGSNVKSAIGPDLVPHGLAVIDATVKRFGPAAADMVTTGVLNSNMFDATGITGTLDRSWRIECFFYMTSAETGLFSLNAPGGFPAVSLVVSNSGVFSESTNNVYTGGGLVGSTLYPSLNAWHHIFIQYSCNPSDANYHIPMWGIDGVTRGPIYAGLVAADYWGSSTFSRIQVGDAGGAHIDEIFFHFNPAVMYGPTYVVPSGPFLPSDTVGTTSGIRGLASSADGTALFAVENATLYYIDRKGVRAARGTLNSRNGYVDMRIGANQLVITDGPNGYVYDLSTQAFARITSSGWLGSVRVAYAGGYFIFSQPNTQTWYISHLEDAATEDPLDFAQAPSSPDNIVCPIADHGEAWLFGSASVEPWANTGGNSSSGIADFPFEQNKGAVMQTGVVAAFSICRLDNTVYWLGRDENGGGVVWRAHGYQPQRISNEAIEQMIQAVIESGADVTQAIAFAYQQNGRSFYVLTIPGLDTTLAYDVAAAEWHDRAELNLATGGYLPSRVTHHAYCYGKHIAGGSDGNLYGLNPKSNNNAGDILVRDRISPHYAQPSLSRIKFGDFELDCRVGAGKPDGTGCTVLMRYSNDGGETWEEWNTVSLGAVGEYKQRARFLRNGSANDRVWQVRVTDDSPFQLVGAKVQAA